MRVAATVIPRCRASCSGAAAAPWRCASAVAAVAPRPPLRSRVAAVAAVAPPNRPTLSRRLSGRVATPPAAMADAAAAGAAALPPQPTVWTTRVIELPPFPRGCHVITKKLLEACPELSEMEAGLANFFIQHTSASLTINENASPDVPLDLNDALDRIAPEGAPPPALLAAAAAAAAAPHAPPLLRQPAAFLSLPPSRIDAGPHYRHDDEGSDDMPAQCVNPPASAFHAAHAALSSARFLAPPAALARSAPPIQAL
jgi:thiamine phosphate synthase YjbQ (UPF0047 family)